MNLIADTLREIFHYLKQYKARTFMTMFGIIWGTISIVVLLAFGLGLKKSMSKNMHGIGESIVIMFPGRTSIPYEGFNQGRHIRFRQEDAELLRNEISNIFQICGEYTQWNTPIRVGSKIIKPNITGVNVEYGDMRYIRPSKGGRWLNKLDMENKRRVVFLGNDLKNFLFGQNTRAISEYVYINDSPFLVIGVMENKTQSSSYSARDKDRAFIPYTTHHAFFGHRYVNNIVYTMYNSLNTQKTQRAIYFTLGKKYKFDPKDSQAINIWDTSEINNFIHYFSLGFNLFMGVIGTMTLTVGGIGLANIMYVVVQERTNEIGIRRSMGAKKHHILFQFMLETLLIISIAALFGALLSLLFIKLIALLPFEEYVGDPSLSWIVVLITISVLTVIGFLAGFFPARRAARMVIIDCLRY
jgi:putative ABC transport system permease protein